jgi:hypothetical protein
LTTRMLPASNALEITIGMKILVLLTQRFDAADNARMEAWKALPREGFDR